MEKITVSLPGIKKIGILPANRLQRQIMYKFLAGIKVGIFADIKRIRFCGSPSCEAVSQYNNNGRIEHTSLKFSTTEKIPTGEHIAFVVTDCNGDSYVIGQREKPRPIIVQTKNTGNPNGNAAVTNVEVSLYAQKSLIPCYIGNS